MRGFTLIELMLVLAIIVFLSTLVPPFVGKNTEALLEQEIEKIVTLCHYLGQRAIATNHIQELCINTAKQCYFFVKNNQTIVNTLSSKIGFSFLPSAWGPPAEPTNPITQAITFPQKNELFIIQFFPNGKMSVGTIYFTDKEKLRMGALTCTSPQVFYIRQYMYKANHWILRSI